MDDLFCWCGGGRFGLRLLSLGPEQWDPGVGSTAHDDRIHGLIYRPPDRTCQREIGKDAINFGFTTGLCQCDVLELCGRFEILFLDTIDTSAHHSCGPAAVSWPLHASKVSDIRLIILPAGQVFRGL